MRTLVINMLQLVLTLGAVWFGITLCSIAMYGGIATAFFLAILAQQIGMQETRERVFRALGREEHNTFLQGLTSFAIAVWFGVTWISLPLIFLYGAWKTRVDHD